MLNILKNSIEDELENSIEDELESFFETLSCVAPDCLAVTKSAFTQARSKLKYTAFIALKHALPSSMMCLTSLRWKPGSTQ